MIITDVVIHVIWKNVVYQAMWSFKVFFVSKQVSKQTISKDVHTPMHSNSTSTPISVHPTTDARGFRAQRLNNLTSDGSIYPCLNVCFSWYTSSSRWAARALTSKLMFRATLFRLTLARPVSGSMTEFPRWAAWTSSGFCSFKMAKFFSASQTQMLSEANSRFISSRVR